MNSDRTAQLGTVEVPASVLTGDGAPLRSFLAPRSADLPGDFADSGAPDSGWRVLPTSHDREGLIFIGAPVERGQWFLGQLTQQDGEWSFSTHGPVVRYPGREQRRAGLELVWPPAAEDAPVDGLFIDVLNSSNDRWSPTPLDDFYTVGTLVAADVPTESSPGYFYAYVSGQLPGCILDPDEYARVHVTIPPDRIVDAGPGEYAVHAAVPSLNLVAELPLRLTITPEDVERARPRHSPRRR